ncbi:MAG: hypothetical protein JWL70_1782 [Acidimicrobiia bacterium]|nr:hypothetical protein [Acidimicrobiia bacterium]
MSPTLGAVTDSWPNDPTEAPAPEVEPNLEAVAPSAEAGLQAELDVMERDLADVEVALVRLDAGTYWTCELTGAPLADDVLAEHPAARRAPTV